MRTISVSELKAHLREVLKAVQDGEIMEVTNRGQVIARIVPAHEQTHDRDKIRMELADLDRLAAEITSHWPAGISALDAVNDTRGEH